MGVRTGVYLEQGKKGIDIEIIKEDATVQDYLDAVNKYILEEEFHRLRRDVMTCEGCSTCCKERIPLTNIDIINLINAPYVQSIIKENSNLKEILEQICQIIVDGRSVDIILDQDEKGSCIFLDQEKGLCRVYQNRPLVCQTYICCTQSEKAKNIRNEIVNLGEDELVRQWILDCISRKELLFFHEATNPDVRFEDWEETTFNTKGYDQVLLKDIFSAKKDDE